MFHKTEIGCIVIVRIILGERRKGSMQKGTTVSILPILMIALILCISILGQVCAHLEPDVNSFWSTETPTIDGILTSGEWTDAATRIFTMEMRSRTDGSLNKTLDAKFYVKNSWSSLYFAVEIFNDDYEAQDGLSNYNGLYVFFEENHDGILASGDNGEAVTTWIGSSFYSRNDLYYQGSYWDADINALKTNDGAISWSHTNPIQGAMGNWTFEMVTPLVGTDGDAYDFDVTQLPRTLGFKIRFEEPGKGTDGVYPDDPSITKNINEATNAMTYGTLIVHPLYTLNVIAGTGGTTNPTPGSYQYPFGTPVSITAIPNPGFILHHWELDTVNVGSTNPYLVTMDQNHTISAVFYELMKLSIDPLATTIYLGHSVYFTSTLTGGVPIYNYQWYLDGSPAPGANSPTWTFAPTSPGVYFVYLNVTDGYGYTVQSETARVEVTIQPVGGYSYSPNLDTSSKTTKMAAYIGLVVMFGLLFTARRRGKL